MIVWLIFIMNEYKRLTDEYAYPGFRPMQKVRIHPDKPGARIITLRRRQKKLYAGAVGRLITHFTTGRQDLCGIYPAEMHRYILKLRYDESDAGRAVK